MRKVKDQLLLLISIFFIVFFLLKDLRLKSQKLVIKKKVLFFYGIIMFFFFFCFANHPQLRYGGYSISFLIISIPMALIFQKYESKKFFGKRLKLLLILTIV